MTSLSVHWSQWRQFSKHELHVHVSHLKQCTAQTHNTPEISWSRRLIHYLAVWNNDCSRFQGRIKEKYFSFLVIINKPQPKLHSGDSCLGPEGTPSIQVPQHLHWFQTSTARSTWLPQIRVEYNSSRSEKSQILKKTQEKLKYTTTDWTLLKVRRSIWKRLECREIDKFQKIYYNFKDNYTILLLQ